MKTKRVPVDITTNEKLRDYLLHKINLFVELQEVGFMVFHRNLDTEDFMQFLLLVSDLCCEGDVSYERRPEGFSLH
jgi:hypothetical protein